MEESFITETKIYNILDINIKDILYLSKGWLVGSSLKCIDKGNLPKDYDIIVCDRQRFQEVLRFILSVSRENKLNTFGGMKFVLNSGIIVDIWCEELSHFIPLANNFYGCYNLDKRILLLKD